VHVVLSYQLKLFPTRNKADTLHLLTGLFARHHTACTTVLREESRCPSSKGLGEFAGRAYRRAWIDWRRTQKAARVTGRPFVTPHLRAELIDSADLQRPKKAKGFDYWILIKGTKDKLYIPARSHRGLNRTLALPGATLNTGTKGSAEVFRKNGTWYARVSVQVPVADVQVPHGWLGCDIGVRAAVTRSDGYHGPDLRPLFRRANERKQNHAKQGRDRHRPLSPSRQVIAKEARKAVTVCLQSGRGIALEDPKRLIRWKQHAARFFAARVLLLAAIFGLAVGVISPPYTSLTCSRCGHVERGQRHKGTFRCRHCGYTVNSDFNASVNMCHTASRVTAGSPGLLSLAPRGGGADE
jgi:Putative transposase DNA-binding domain